MNKLFQDSLYIPGNVSVETLQKLNDINTKTLARLAEMQISLATLGFETTVEQAKLLSDSGNYADLYSVESSLASAYSDKLLKISQKTTGIFMESSDEFATVIENIFDAAKDKVTTSPSPVATAAPTKKAAVKAPSAPAKKATVKASSTTKKKTVAKPAAKPAAKSKKVAKKSAR